MCELGVLGSPGPSKVCVLCPTCLVICPVVLVARFVLV